MEQPKRLYTPAEYLALEAAADYKSEYDNGQIVALAGGSSNHNLIAINVASSLNVALEARPCRVYGSDMRLSVEHSGLYTYPDVMVVCGRPRFLEGRTDTVENPVLIVEVLSASTREYDRIKKFARYKQLESLREYLLVDSEQVHVTRLAKLEPSDKWTIEMYDDLDAAAHLDALDLELPLRRMYSKVEF